MNDSLPEGNRRSEQGAPRLAVLAAICVGLLFVGIAIGVARGGVMPLPYGPVAAVRDYVRTQPTAIQVIAVAMFVSSVPLAVYVATANVRLRELGAPLGAAIALAGGILATGALGLSGLVAWMLSRPEVSGAATLVPALYLLVFLLGSVGHLAALGLLVAGIAVPSFRLGLLARPLAWSGVAIAVLSELTVLVLVWPVLGPMLPVARVAGLAWLIAAGARLPLRRNDIRAS